MKKTKKLLNKSKEKNVTSTKLFLVLVFFCLCILSYSTKSHSYSVEPAIEEFVLELNQEATSSTSFTNTTGQEQDFKIYTHRYNPQKQQILEERNFITLENSSFSLEPGQTENIEYKINIPEDVIPGSYFSIIVVENLKSEDSVREGGFGLNYGVGSLIAMHVIDDVDISEVFLNETQTELRYIKPLNPFYTLIEYRIKNNSKYTFLPTGQLIIASGKTKPIFYNINQEENKLYPNQELKFKFEYRGSFKDLVLNKTAIAKVTSQYSNNVKETQMTLPYLTQTFRISAALLGFVFLVTVLIITVRKSQDSSMKEKFKKKMSKKN